MITYQETQDFNPQELQALFLSVGWSSGQYPDKLVLALKNSHSVISAWDGGRLVGLMNCLADGVMTAYFHYLLVLPDYHGRGIGRTLVSRMLTRYESYARKVLIAYNNEAEFYQRCGFTPADDKVAMFITSLTT